jgi:hypothetical protein
VPDEDWPFAPVDVNDVKDPVEATVKEPVDDPHESDQDPATASRGVEPPASAPASQGALPSAPDSGIPIGLSISVGPSVGDMASACG